MKLPSRAGHHSIRVLVADSDPIQSQLLSSAVRRQPRFKVTSCKGELSACLKALVSAPADVVLLGDGPSDGSHLIEVLRGVHAAYPKVGLVLLLENYDRDLIVSSMRAGARGLFCCANRRYRALGRCISAVHQGQFWTNTEQMGYVIDALATTLPVRINAKGKGLLTPREEQVVNLAAEGRRNRDIARELGVNENTVKKSLLRIYDKLGVSNRVELVLYALSHSELKRSASPPPKNRRLKKHHDTPGEE
jgi:DNA-binding NarL/FixJ family response regulator